MRIRSSFVLAAILCAAPALAQTAPSHGWIDVNYISLHPAQDAQTFTFKTTIASETASAAAAYPKLPVKTVPELVTWMKANPAEAKVATSGRGSAQEMAAEMFRMVSGAPVLLVPYKGSSAAHPDQIGRAHV